MRTTDPVSELSRERGGWMGAVCAARGHERLTMAAVSGPVEVAQRGRLGLGREPHLDSAAAVTSALARSGAALCDAALSETVYEVGELADRHKQELLSLLPCPSNRGEPTEPALQVRVQVQVKVELVVVRVARRRSCAAVERRTAAHPCSRRLVRLGLLLEACRCVGPARLLCWCAVCAISSGCCERRESRSQRQCTSS